MKLNVALVKRITGGDKLIVRPLYKNPIEFTPQFKIFTVTNHHWLIEDETVFESDRFKVIPFDKHFTEDERDLTLKLTFKTPENTSAIFNWILDGYKMFKVEGLIAPERAVESLNVCRMECNPINLFIKNTLERADKAEHVETNALYEKYLEWCEEYKIEDVPQNVFVPFLRKIGPVRRHAGGNVLKGYKYKKDDSQSTEQ